MKGILSLVEMEEAAGRAPACSCEECAEMCNRPCWPTPEEASKLIELGYGDALMLDYWSASPDIYLLCPAEKGREGMTASFIPTGGCVMLKDGLCALHGICKPLEGRAAHHAKCPDGLHQSVAALWDSDEGRAVVDTWRNERG